MVTHILVRVGCLQPALTPECPVVDDGALLRAGCLQLALTPRNSPKKNSGRRFHLLPEFFAAPLIRVQPLRGTFNLHVPPQVSVSKVQNKVRCKSKDTLVNAGPPKCSKAPQCSNALTDSRAIAGTLKCN
jgi:hypothetical protein